MTFEQWQATRQWADDLDSVVECDLGGVSGYHYSNGHIEARGLRFGVVIATTEEEFATLEEAEQYLWTEWAEGECADEAPSAES